MQLTNTHKIIISIVIVIVLLTIYIFFDGKSPGQDQLIRENQISTSTAIGSNNIGITSEGGGYKIEQVPITEGKGVPKPMPDLSRPVFFDISISLTPEIKTMITERITGMQTELKKNASNFSAWLDLGTYQKMGGDYAGTILSWEYASRLAPADYISLGNLGNLYAYFLKDSAKAETYYKQAIARGPMQAYLYVQLAEVYRDINKDSTKALAIINTGLSKIPNNPDLLQLKSSLTK